MISVIIPTHNRHLPLRKTLAALGEQTLSRSAFEVIVVDDGSGEPTRREIRQLQTPFTYSLLEKAQGGLASARNHGADHAKGRILLFLDDDVIPARTTLEQHLRSHAAQGEPVAVVGSLPFPGDVELDCFLWYLEQVGHYDLYKNPRKYPGGKPPLPPLNGNSSLPRDLFFRIGKYDETFARYGSEDLELGHRLARAGVKFVYNPDAVGYHDHIKDFARFCEDVETAGESLIRLYRKYPEIKVSKKIDLLEDSLGQLPWRKKTVKLIMTATLRLPWILAAPRAFLRLVEPHLALRHVAFPLYKWVAHYHYARGMRRGLAGGDS